MDPEQELLAKLNKAMYQCKNVYAPEELLNLYINGLHPTIRSVAARYRKYHYCIT